MTDFIQCGYCLTLNNYYTSPEIDETLLSLETDCYRTLKKKQNLPHDFWNWKPKKGDPPTKQFKGEIMALRWNDVTETKSVKIVSMLSTIHLGQLMDKGKKNHTTKEVIYKPDVIVNHNKTMGGVDLLRCILIPYFTQQWGVKQYRKVGELMLDISFYNSFIVYQELNPENGIKDHMRY